MTKLEEIARSILVRRMPVYRDDRLWRHVLAWWNAGKDEPGHPVHQHAVAEAFKDAVAAVNGLYSIPELACDIALHSTAAHLFLKGSAKTQNRQKVVIRHQAMLRAILAGTV